MHKPGIYAIVRIETGRMYIGQAADIQDRWMRHLWRLRNDKHDNRLLLRDWKKYGEVAFEFRVLADLSHISADKLRDELNRLEIETIAATKPRARYNKSKGGRKQPPISDETRAKLSAERKARWANPEYRARVTATLQAKAKDPEFHERRIAAVTRGKRTPEARATMAAHANRRWAEEGAKETFGQIHAAKWADPEYKAKQVAARKASWQDPEIKARRSAAIKAAWADPETKARRQAAMQLGKKIAKWTAG